VGPEVRAGDQEDGGGPAGQNADDLAEERLALAARVAGERIRLVPRGYGVALTAILVALAGLVGWSVIGTVPSSVHLTGVLVHGDGPQAVPATVAGTVVDVQVKPGDAVRRGQTLATVRRPAAAAPRCGRPPPAPCSAWSRPRAARCHPAPRWCRSTRTPAA
jgi:hypothetical protein